MGDRVTEHGVTGVYRLISGMILVTCFEQIPLTPDFTFDDICSSEKWSAAGSWLRNVLIGFALRRPVVQTLHPDNHQYIRLKFRRGKRLGAVCSGWLRQFISGRFELLFSS